VVGLVPRSDGLVPPCACAVVGLVPRSDGLVPELGLGPFLGPRCSAAWQHADAR
jgi:hypothetical protein